MHPGTDGLTGFKGETLTQKNWLGNKRSFIKIEGHKEQMEDKRPTTLVLMRGEGERALKTFHSLRGRRISFRPTQV